MDIIQDIWEDYKKPIIIVLAVILVFIIGMITFYTVYNPIKITFTGDDAEIIATMRDLIQKQISVAAVLVIDVLQDVLRTKPRF